MKWEVIEEEALTVRNAIDLTKAKTKEGWEFVAQFTIGASQPIYYILVFKRKIPEPPAPQKRRFVEPTEIPDGEAD